MEKFKCPRCGSSHTAEEWNTETQRSFGGEITKIEDGKDSCEYACPYCCRDVDGSKIEKVFE